MSQEKDSKSNPIEGIIKKVVSVGVGAAFMTEESVKKVLEDLPLPKDVLNGLMQNAKSAKEDFSTGIREEVKNYLSKVDATKLAASVLEKFDLEIEAKVRFKKKEEKSHKHHKGEHKEDHQDNNAGQEN